MKILRIHYILILLLGLLFAEQPQFFSQEFQLPENPLEGQKVFVNKGCVKCHSIFGEGGKIGSDLGRSQANKTALGILAAMWNHSGEMSQAMVRGQNPAQLAPNEMAALLSFLYYLKYFGHPGSAENGARLIQSKRCLQCHSVGGKGGTVAPALNKLNRYASPVLIAQEMWNHGAKMMRYLKEKNLPFPVLSGNEIADLLAYIQSLNPAPPNAVRYAFPGSPNRGAILFKEKKCIQCHRVNGEGGTIGPDLSQRPFHQSVDEIAAIMWNHAPKMMEKMQSKGITPPQFKDNEMADIIAYLYFLDFRIQPGDVAQGKKIFEAKKCNKCHSLNGYQGKTGPNLARVKGLNDIITISTAMWNHNIKMQQEMKKQHIPYPRFTGTELKNLLTFIRSNREREDVQE